MDGKADFSGYLKKKGAKVKAYRKRWFELRGTTLYYFRSKKHKKPAGVIELGGDCVLELNKKKSNAFKISGEGLRRTFEMAADKKASLNAWLEALGESIKKAGNSKSSVVQAEEESSGGIFARGSKDDIDVKYEDFKELKVIGRGSFGKVLKVVKIDSGEIFALKILKKEMIIKENMVEHTIAEKDILARINHPFIVTLHYAFQSKTKLFLVLEFLSGGELFFHLKNETFFSLEKARYYTAEIVSALGYLHMNNIIYRDLKPENCVINNHGHVTITDFGLAKNLVANETQTFCGTPEYLAPEIVIGEGHNKAVDWWSLGCLLYEMLTGLPPFYSENTNEIYELILEAPLTFDPKMKLDKDAVDLLKKLLIRDPDKRLGGGSADAEEIKAHKFFKTIDWDKLERCELKPPFIPNLSGDDTKYFEEDFTGERLKQTVANPVSKKQDISFKAFGFNRGEEGGKQ